MASKKSSPRLTRRERSEKRYSIRFRKQQQARAASKRFVAKAKELAPIAPALKKLSRQRILSAAQKGLVTRTAKKVRGVNQLYPLTKKQAKQYKDYLFKPGIQAIRLRNTASDAKVFFGEDGLIVTSNGRTWIYWPLDYEIASNKKGQLGGAAKKAFDKEFPIEKAAKLAELAFANLKVKSITLWTQAGRADQTFASLKQFLFWMHQKWQAGRYVRVDEMGDTVDQTDSGAWINGLAIEVETIPKGMKKK